MNPSPVSRRHYPCRNPSRLQRRLRARAFSHYRSRFPTPRIDATTAGKLEGTSRGVEADPLPMVAHTCQHTPETRQTTPTPHYTLKCSVDCLVSGRRLAFVGHHIFLFLLRPFPVSRYCFVSSIPFPTFLSFSPLNHIAQRKKLKPDTKVGGDQMQLVPMISKVGRDASHKAVAPMTPSKLK